MADRTQSRTTAYPVKKIGYLKGSVRSVDRKKDTADVDCGGQIYRSVPVFYNCPAAGAVLQSGPLKNSARAFAKGDEVLVRTFDGKPSHVIGFTGDLWPCIKTPAYVYGGYVLDENSTSFSMPGSSLFYERYKALAAEQCWAFFTTYINDENADTGTGFVSVQKHWTDTEYHRDTKCYMNGNFIFQTLNDETFDHVFNGTRSNILGSFIHPDESGQGCLVYQVNTFYDWKPRTSGRVVFDFYLYITDGTHTKLATAECIVTGSVSPASGLAVKCGDFHAASDELTGRLLYGNVQITDAGSFSSDGSTNSISTGDSRSAHLLFSTGDETEMLTVPLSSEGVLSLPDGYVSPDDINIYIKNR